MKINKFFTAAMAATLMLASCANENETGNNGSGDDTYAGVTVTIPAETRANGDVNASDEESKISSIGVYIVDRSTNAIHSDVLTSSDFTQSATDGSATATKAVKTTTGTKDVYVIVNPTAALTTKIESMRNLAFKNILELDETAYYSTTSGNLKDMVMTGLKANHDMTTVVKEANAFDAGKVLAITVARNASKVVLKEKNPMTVDGGTVSDIKFAMVAKNKDSYISSAMTTANGTPHSTVPASATTNSADPYFNYFSGNTPADADYLAIVGSAVTRSAAKGFFVLENNTDNNRIGNTTAVRIKLKYTPTAAKGSKIIGSWAKGADTDTEGIATVGDLGADGTFYVYTGGDNSYWSEAAYTAATHATNGKLAASDFSAKYDKGTCYYKIYVAATNDGEKCVLRNYYYEMTLAHIKGPGKPSTTEEKKDPVEDDTWLGIELKMEKWNMAPTEWTIQ